MSNNQSKKSVCCKGCKGEYDHVLNVFKCTDTKCLNCHSSQDLEGESVNFMQVEDKAHCFFCHLTYKPSEDPKHAQLHYENNDINFGACDELDELQDECKEYKGHSKPVSEGKECHCENPDRHCDYLDGKCPVVKVGCKCANCISTKECKKCCKLCNYLCSEHENIAKNTFTKLFSPDFIKDIAKENVTPTESSKKECDHRCSYCIEQNYSYCSVCRDDVDGTCPKCPTPPSNALRSEEWEKVRKHILGEFNAGQTDGLIQNGSATFTAEQQRQNAEYNCRDVEIAVDKVAKFFMSARADERKKMGEEIQNIINAWVDEGRMPPYHREQQERLRREWSTLYQAIIKLVNNKK